MRPGDAGKAGGRRRSALVACRRGEFEIRAAAAGRWLVYRHGVRLRGGRPALVGVEPSLLAAEARVAALRSDCTPNPNTTKEVPSMGNSNSNHGADPLRALRRHHKRLAEDIAAAGGLDGARTRCGSCEDPDGPFTARGECLLCAAYACGQDDGAQLAVRSLIVSLLAPPLRDLACRLGEGEVRAAVERAARDPELTRQDGPVVPESGIAWGA